MEADRIRFRLLPPAQTIVQLSSHHQIIFSPIRPVPNRHCNPLSSHSPILKRAQYLPTCRAVSLSIVLLASIVWPVPNGPVKHPNIPFAGYDRNNTRANGLLCDVPVDGYHADALANIAAGLLWQTAAIDLIAD